MTGSTYPLFYSEIRRERSFPLTNYSIQSEIRRERRKGGQDQQKQKTKATKTCAISRRKKEKSQKEDKGSNPFVELEDGLSH